MGDAKPSISIRDAGPEQLGDVVRLLSLRDGEELVPGAVAGDLFDLDPNRLRAWVAYVDGDPAAVNAIYLRRLRDLNHPGRELTAGYWAHLYVRPEYRKLMIYPRLILTLIRSAPAMGVEVLFTGTRQREVAEGHQRLGFKLIGTLPVRAMPLRPFRFLARYKSLDGAAALGRPLDALFRALMRLLRAKPADDTRIEGVPLAAPDVQAFVNMMNADGAEKVSQVWDVDYFRKRFEVTIDNRRYTLLAARRSGRIVAGIIFSVANHEHRVRLGVIVDLLYQPGEAAAADALVDAAERRLFADDCDIVLHLDGMGPAVEKVFAARRYRTAPDVYHMLVWSKKLFEDGTPNADLARWRFAFSDHDAF